MWSRRALLATLPATLLAQQRRFVRSYFFIEPETKLILSDLAVGSDRKLWAVGATVSDRSRPKGALVSTDDGGQSWQLAPLRFLPNSLFALNDSSLWAVSDKGEVWYSAESGRDWKKLSREKNALKVHFLNNQTGFLVGAKKTLMRTDDGGRKWRHVPEAAQVTGNPDNFVYRSVEFWNGKIGLVNGNVELEPANRRRGPDLPDWMTPERGILNDRPRVLVTLESTDAGTTWKKQEVSGFGYVHRSIIGSDGQGFTLLKFRKGFPFGGELYRFAVAGEKKSGLLLRLKDLEFQDVCYIPGDGVYLACTERLGALPVPTKVRVKYSRDMVNWSDIAVDYRAVASRITLLPTPSGQVFAALDQGTILALR